MLGFPCNQFGAQEPGTDEEILEFVTTKFGVDFPMFSKIEVNGDGACELYRLLTAAAPEPDGSTAIGWNFTKFVVDRDGTPLRRFGPADTPEQIRPYLEELLG